MNERWTVRYLVRADQRLLRWASRADLAVSFREVDLVLRRFHCGVDEGEGQEQAAAWTWTGPFPTARTGSFGYYGYPYYWGDSERWGMVAYPGVVAVAGVEAPPADYPERSGDVHLRSAKEVPGYHIQGATKRSATSTTSSSTTEDLGSTLSGDRHQELVAWNNASV